MKWFADKHRTERVFHMGVMVYLQPQPYRQAYVVVYRNLKLALCYFGPYPVTARSDPVVYRLGLPLRSKIHPVFHISQLKKP